MFLFNFFSFNQNLSFFMLFLKIYVWHKVQKTLHSNGHILYIIIFVYICSYILKNFLPDLFNKFVQIVINCHVVRIICVCVLCRQKYWYRKSSSEYNDGRKVLLCLKPSPPMSSKSSKNCRMRYSYMTPSYY